MKRSIHFCLNGKSQEVICEGHERLIDILRDQLGLTGTKEGCGIGECGACTVLLNGRPVRSCLVLWDKIEGASVETIEGVGSMERPHTIQEAFVQNNAIQCGFCTPAMIMTAKALLEKHPEPSDVQIREAISGNLCRCTGYEQIRDAIRDASRQLMMQEGGKPDE